MGAHTPSIDILLIEDDGSVARAIERHLRRAGYAVTTALRGLEALSARPADIAVVDIDLPDIDGVTVAVELVRRFRVSRVVFFTATADGESRARARLLGPVIDKSEGIEALLAALRDEREKS